MQKKLSIKETKDLIALQVFSTMQKYENEVRGYILEPGVGKELHDFCHDAADLIFDALFEKEFQSEEDRVIGSEKIDFEAGKSTFTHNPDFGLQVYKVNTRFGIREIKEIPSAAAGEPVTVTITKENHMPCEHRAGQYLPHGFRVCTKCHEPFKPQ